MRVGRTFNDRDDSKAPKVAIINETLARKYFENENPIGQHIGSNLEQAGQIEIVGILRDAKYDSVRDDVPPTMYLPYLQRPLQGAVFHVRTAGPPAGAIGVIRDAMRKIDPNLPLMNVATQTETVEKRLQQERVFAQAYALFGALALVLASIGLFGLMSYNVARRTNEIGIRMALGAQRRDVLRLVMGESMTLVVIGVGWAGVAFAASRRSSPGLGRPRGHDADRDGGAIAARRSPATCPRRAAVDPWSRCTTSSALILPRGALSSNMAGDAVPRFAVRAAGRGLTPTAASRTCRE